MLNLDSAVKPQKIAASTDAPSYVKSYVKKVLFTNKVTTNFFTTPFTPLATILSTSSTAESRLKRMPTILFALLTIILSTSTFASSCKDAVVLVHGNTASPSSWDNTYNLLLSNGYDSADIFRPDWGSKYCAGCNNHYGSEETPVNQAISEAIAHSCTGQIDVISHSMGATLAAQQINKLAAASYVDAFVGIAGAFRGLWSCGVYPFNVWSSTCGYYGLSVQSPFLDSLYGSPLGDRVYSIKSDSDQIVCAFGVCSVGGVHSSSIWNEDSSYDYSLGHFELQTDTAQKQLDLIQ